jgi:hypothetical protein
VSRSKHPAKSAPQSPVERVKALPWALLLQTAVVIGNRWRALSAKDRARLARIARESRGRPASLGPKEREELRRIAGKLDVKRMLGELVALARMSRGKRRRA